MPQCGESGLLLGEETIFMERKKTQMDLQNVFDNDGFVKRRRA
jgi:hypothetical protein